MRSLSLFLLCCLHAMLSGAQGMKDYAEWRRLAREAPPGEKNHAYRLSCYQKALDLCGPLGLTQEALDIRRNIADIHFQQHRYDLAEKELLSILQPAEKASHENVLFAYDLLAALYTAQSNYNKALSYALKTIRTMSTAADSSRCLRFYYRLENIYELLGDYGSSLQWLERCNGYVLRYRSGDTSLLLNLSGHIVDKLIKLGRKNEALQYALRANAVYAVKTPADQYNLWVQLGSCYFSLNRYDEAETYYLRVLSLIEAYSDQLPANCRPATYTSVGSMYLSTHRPAIAKRYLLKALAGFERIGSPYDIKEANYFLFKADSALGDYQTAIAYLQRSNLINDSIFTAGKNKQISELQIAYNTEQKNAEIKALQDRDSLQALGLRHEQSTRNWIIAGSCMLLIIAGLLYRQAVRAKETTRLFAGKNEILERLVSEKEWLLKEVHHRVKNNLQTVIALLESQARYLDNDALKAIESSQHRIFAMSLIHQKLYRAENMRVIDMAEYIPELVRHLETSFDVSDQIRFRSSIDAVSLDIGYAIPIGLIINEAVTNSIKYAFPGDRHGAISIQLRAGEGLIRLEMADDGIGIPEGRIKGEAHSLGIELMKGLSGDIDAEIRFETSLGTRIIVVMKS